MADKNETAVEKEPQTEQDEQVKQTAQTTQATRATRSKSSFDDSKRKWRVHILNTPPLSMDIVKRRLALYPYNPVLWAKEVCGFIPDPQQEPILAGYLEKRFNAFKSGHGTGKTCTLSVTSLHFLSTRHLSVVPSTAPSQHQLFDLLWKEHHKWIRKSPFLDKMLEWTQQKISVRGYGEEWHAIARTARARAGDTSNVGLQGFHAGPHSGGLLYAIDEASGVAETSMNAVEGALSEADVYVAMGGNPTHLYGTFHEAFNKASHLWPGLYTLSCLQSYVVAEGYATRIGEKYGYESDEYRIKVLGEFPEKEAHGLVPTAYVDLAFQLGQEDVDEGRGDVEAGLDVALGGANRTVMILRRGGYVFKKDYCKYTKEEEIAKWVAARLESYSVKKVAIDCIGPGSGVSSHLRQMGYKSKIQFFKSNHKPIGEKSRLGYDPDELFVNLRAQVYWYLRGLFSRGQIALGYDKDDDAMRHQLTNIQVDRETGKLRIEKKEQMLSRGMPSPDEADALMLAFAPDVLKHVSERLMAGSGVTDEDTDRELMGAGGMNKATGIGVRPSFFDMGGTGVRGHEQRGDTKVRGVYRGDSGVWDSSGMDLTSRGFWGTLDADL